MSCSTACCWNAACRSPNSPTASASIANLSILKTGKARAVRFSTLDALCRELQCQPGDLMGFEPGPGDGGLEDVD